MYRIDVTDREAKIVRKAIEGTPYADLKITWSHRDGHRTVMLNDVEQAQMISGLIFTTRQVLINRGEKQVAGRLYNDFMKRVNDAITRVSREKAQKIEQLERKIAEAQEVPEYFVERFARDGGFFFRARAVAGKHGESALAKTYIRVSTKINLGIMEVTFTVADREYNGEKFDGIKDIAEAEMLATEMLKNKMWERQQKAAANIDDFKAELAQLRAA